MIKRYLRLFFVVLFFFIPYPLYSIVSQKDSIPFDAGASLNRHLSFLLSHAVSNDYHFLFSGFSFKEIEHCRSAIHEKKSLEPLYWTWQQHHKKIIENGEMLREFSILIIMIYQNLILHEGQSRGIPWLGLVSLYMKLNAIPLQKLFDVLEECFIRYQMIFEEYSSGSFTKESILEWFDQNWWLPVTAMTMGIVVFARWYKTRHLTPSGNALRRLF